MSMLLSAVETAQSFGLLAKLSKQESTHKKYALVSSLLGLEMTSPEA